MPKKQFVRFVSRRKFLQLALRPEHAIISISDTDEERQEILEHLDDREIPSDQYLALTFPDVDDRAFFQEARSIVDFIEQHKTQNFVVHCFLGVSRSGAIAKFINEYLELEDPYLDTYAGHNRAVFDALLCRVGMSMTAYFRQMEQMERGGHYGS